MPDWTRLIRESLPPLAAGREREDEIVAELALQLEQAYNEAMAGGATEEEALRRARAQFRDWNRLGQPDRLVAIETRKAEQPELEPWTSALDFFDAPEQTHSFASMAALSPVWDVVLTGRGRAERLQCLFVSAEFFPLLGVTATAGRLFLTGEDRRAQPSRVVVISHALWQRRFGEPGLLLEGASVEPAGHRAYSIDHVPAVGRGGSGSGLTGASVTFTWSPATGASAYRIDIGTTAADSISTARARRWRPPKPSTGCPPMAAPSMCGSGLRRAARGSTTITPSRHREERRPRC